MPLQKPICFIKLRFDSYTEVKTFIVLTENVVDMHRKCRDMQVSTLSAIASCSYQTISREKSIRENQVPKKHMLENFPKRLKATTFVGCSPSPYTKVFLENANTKMFRNSPLDYFLLMYQEKKSLEP